MDKAKEVSKELKSIKDSIVLAAVSLEDYPRINTNLLKHIIKEEKLPGIYVTLNKPF